MIISLPELYFRFRRLIILVQTNTVISMNYGSSKSSWKPWRWVGLALILLMGDIYINSNLNPLLKFTSSSRSTEFKDILPWNIPKMITKTVSISKRIVISYAMKWAIPLLIWWNVNGNWDNNMIRISQWRESLCKTNTSIKRKKEIQKSTTVRIKVWDPSRKVNHLSKFVWDRKIITEVEVKVSQGKQLADGLIERTSSMLDEIETKTVHKDKEGDQYRKKN